MGAWKRGSFWLVPVNDTTGVIIDTGTQRVFPPVPLGVGVGSWLLGGDRDSWIEAKAKTRSS